VKGRLARLTNREIRRPRQTKWAPSKLNVRTADLWNSSICLVSFPDSHFILSRFFLSFFFGGASLQGRPVRGTRYAVVQ
jgi:hypothetical protein